MPVKYILYNPDSGVKTGRSAAEALKSSCENAVFINICRISSYKVFFNGLEKDAEVILCGGDGTLNRFANEIRDISISNDIFCCPTGIMNTAAESLGRKKGSPPFCINSLLDRPPSVVINGEDRVFLRSIGLGIEGYCCETANMHMQQSKKPKPVSYKAIAAVGMLFKAEPVNAEITVDGQNHSFKNVWLAAVENKGDRLSLTVLRCSDRVKGLWLLNSVYKDGSGRHPKNISIFTGSHISLKADRSAPIHIDGEVISDVTSFDVKINQERNLL